MSQAKPAVSKTTISFIVGLVVGVLVGGFVGVYIGAYTDSSPAPNIKPAARTSTPEVKQDDTPAEAPLTEPERPAEEKPATEPQAAPK